MMKIVLIVIIGIILNTVSGIETVKELRIDAYLGDWYININH